MANSNAIEHTKSRDKRLDTESCILRDRSETLKTSQTRGRVSINARETRPYFLLHVHQEFYSILGFVAWVLCLWILTYNTRPEDRYLSRRTASVKSKVSFALSIST